MRSILNTILALLIGSATFSQSYNFRKYGERDGLPSSFVYDITQDSMGRMWFATSKGPAFYDGIHWNSFKDSGLELPNSIGSRLFPGNRNEIYFGGFRNKEFTVSKYSNLKWSKFDFPIFRLFEREGIKFSFNRHEDKVQLVAFQKANLFIVDLNSHSFERFEIQGIESINRIIPGNAPGEIYLAHSNGLERLLFDVKTKSIDQASIEALIGINVFHALVDDKELNWILANSGVYKLVDEKAEQIFELPKGNRDDFHDFAQIIQNQKEQIFFSLGSPTRVILTENDQYTIMDLANSSDFKVPNGLFFDNQDNLWMNTLRGAIKIPSFRFLNHKGKQNIFLEEPTAIASFSSGEILVGSYGSVSINKGDNWKFIDISGGASKEDKLRMRLIDLCNGPDNSIFITSQNFGTTQVFSDGRFRKIGKYSNVSSVHFQNDSLFLFLTDLDILVSTGNFSKFQRFASSTGYVRKVEIIGKKRFILSRNGISEFSRYPKPIRNPGYPYSETYSMIIFEGRMLIGTFGGLCELDIQTNSITPAKLGGKEFIRPVFNMIKDSGGALWLGTDLGLFKFKDSEFYNLETSDGLSGNEINRRGLFEDNEGKLWIATNAGLSVYNPMLDNIPLKPPLPVFEGLYVGGSKVYGDELNNLPSFSSVKFNFSGASYYNEENLVFRVKLTPMESDWVLLDEDQRGIKEYYNLPSGKFKFEFQARNGDGNWSHSGFSPEFRILKPFYLTDAFIAFSIALLIGIGFILSAFFNQRINQGKLEDSITQKTIEIQESKKQLELRNLELNKANRELDNFVFRASHDLRAPLASIMGLVNLSLDQNDIEAIKSYLILIQGNLEKQDKLIQEITKHSRNLDKPIELEKINFHDLIPGIIENLKYSVSPNEISIQIDVNQTRHFQSDQNRIEIILNNLISNSIRYRTNRNPEIKIELNELSSGIEISVEDNGVGIPDKDQDRIFEMFYRGSASEGGTGLGLFFVKELVNKLKGKIEFFSEENVGTRFKLYIPGRFAENIIQMQTGGPIHG